MKCNADKISYKRSWSGLHGEDLDRAHWAPVGKAALAKRLMASAWIQATAPMKTVLRPLAAMRRRCRGLVRMIDCPDDPALTPEAMLAPHRARTLCRMRAQSTVLAIKDGSDLNVARTGPARVSA